MDQTPDPVDDAVLDDLRARLRNTRRTPLTTGTGWDRGTDPDYLADLVGYWAQQYDWRPHEQRILALPWVLDELGHRRYVVCGGDVGSGVAEAIALTRPDQVAAMHLTDVPLSHLAALPEEELTDADRAYQAGGQRWTATEGAYLLEQSTKPHTLAAGLGDSPAGLAAWIAEKLRSWSDCGGDVETAFPREDLLTWLTLYWVTGTIGSSCACYYERARPGDTVIGTPTAITQFAHDLVKAPRSVAERFLNVQAWQEEQAGGHFAAWERPDAYVAGVRAAVALAWD